MATERIIDLANQRYADREHEDLLPVVPDPALAAREHRQRLALDRMRARAAGHSELARDVLILLGLDE